MERDHNDFFFLNGTSVDDGCYARGHPLVCRPAEVTGDSSEVDRLGATAAAHDPEPEGEEAAETSSSSRNSCLCSFSAAGQPQQVGAPGATSMPSGADQVRCTHSGRLGDDSAREGSDFGLVYSDCFPWVGNGDSKGGYTSSSEDDEADSWRTAVTGTAARTGGICSGASTRSNGSCVAEFNRWDLQLSRPPVSGWVRRIRRGPAPASAERAETDRAFWEACLSSGYP